MKFTIYTGSNQICESCGLEDALYFCYLEEEDRELAIGQECKKSNNY